MLFGYHLSLLVGFTLHLEDLRVGLSSCRTCVPEVDIITDYVSTNQRPFHSDRWSFPIGWVGVCGNHYTISPARYALTKVTSE